MDSSTEKKINTDFLPEDWKQQLADRFDCTAWKVEKIVYQQVKITAKNIHIFKAALDMAEAGKAAINEVDKRLAALSA